MSPQESVPVDEYFPRMNNTCKISVQNKGNIARNILESMPVDSPINHPKKRKNTLEEDDCPLKPGWLEDIFSNPRDTQPGCVQHMNWKIYIGDTLIIKMLLSADVTICVHQYETRLN